VGRWGGQSSHHKETSLFTQFSPDDLPAGGIMVQAIEPNHSETVVEARGLTHNHCETVVEAVRR
jgi:hypothetical protein